MGRSGIKETHAPDQSSTYTLNKPDPVSFNLSDGMKVTISTDLSTSNSLLGVEIHEGHTVSFDSGDRSLPRDDLLDYMRRFSCALTLFTGHPVYLERIYLEVVTPTARTAELLYVNKGITTAETREIYHNMLVNFSEISDRIADVMTRWYDTYSRVDSALNLYFGTVFYPSLYSNHHFLFLAQALEVYHRTNPAFEDTAQKTLAQRLDELLTRHQTYASRFIDDLKVFAETVRATRNHYTHYSTKASDLPTVAKDAELARVTYQLKTLLEICILSDLGIEGKPMDRLVSRFGRIQFAD